MKKKWLVAVAAALVGILSAGIGGYHIYQANAAENVNVEVSVAEAIQTYQKEYPDTTITSIDLDKTLGKYSYDIQGVDETTEYEVKVQAVDGTVTKKRTEQLDTDEQNGVAVEEKLNLENLKTMEEISATAEKAVTGGTAVDWELEQELGTTYWTVKVKDGRTTYEVEIDAQSGTVLSMDTDD